MSFKSVAIYNKFGEPLVCCHAHGVDLHQTLESGFGILEDFF